MKILIVAPNWIGDAIMAEPLLRRIRADYALAHVVVLAPVHLADLFAAMPEVNEVVAAPLAHGGLQWRLRRELARRFRGFDLAWVLPNSFKSALVPWLAGIRARLGYLGESRWWLLNERLPNPPRGRERPPMVSAYAALAELGPAAALRPALPPLDARGEDRPRLVVDVAAAAIAKARFLDAGRPAVALCPGAEYGPAKRWPPAHFAALAALIAAHAPSVQIVCLGGPKDAPIAEAIAQATSTPMLNLCGKTTLAQAMALMHTMTAVVSNDSGLMHIAAALDVPVVALYGSTDPHHTPPHSPLAAIVQLELDCRPCFARTCPLGHLACLQDLSPERVWHALAPRLAARGVSAQ